MKHLDGNMSETAVHFVKDEIHSMRAKMEDQQSSFRDEFNSFLAQLTKAGEENQACIGRLNDRFIELQREHEAQRSQATTQMERLDLLEQRFVVDKKRLQQENAKLQEQV